MSKGRKIVVIGAGIGGLCAAITLAAHGCAVTLVERHAWPGGKMRRIKVGPVRIDGGPTVFTMRHIFDEVLALAGTRLEEHVRLRQAQILARHAWPDGSMLDLYTDIERTAQEIAAFAGPVQARQYKRFCADARSVFKTLDQSYMRQPMPGMINLLKNASLPALHRTRPFSVLWNVLGGYFKDQRLRQLFARYATYVGSSPFEAPATLMLIAHVEQAGVWLVDGGMHALATALQKIAQDCGADLRFGNGARRLIADGSQIRTVELEDGVQIKADAVIYNGDTNALAHGLLGDQAARAGQSDRQDQRSLSALTLAMHAPVRGFPLVRHNVFFSSDYRREFAQLFGGGTLPDEPTVYICAQDRQDQPLCEETPERLLCLVNAPARGDTRPLTREEIQKCETATFDLLARMGLSIGRTEQTTVRTTPQDFERLFPATGGALYGRAAHGWRATMSKPGVRTSIKGLYLAGGSVHPGAGVPMAALSGLTAARALLADFTSTSRSARAAMSGGMLTG